MNAQKRLIIIKGKDKTDSVASFRFHDGKCDVVYTSSPGRIYSFQNRNVEILPLKKQIDPAQVIVNHVAQKQIERTERKRSRMSEFDLPVDDPPMPVAEPEAGKKGKKNAPVRPDVFVENSRRKAAEEKAAEAAEQGPDILAERPKPVKDYKKQLEALRQEELAKAEQKPEAAEAPQELPHQFPPLILENRSADGEETEAAEAPEPVEDQARDDDPQGRAGAGAARGVPGGLRRHLRLRRDARAPRAGRGGLRARA